MTHGDQVVLVVPSRGEYARTVRITAAELAARVDMDLDGVDDVRLAVEEAFVFAVERVVGSQLTFTFTLSPHRIELTVGPMPLGCETEDEPGRSERYARFILESICEEFEILEVDGVCLLRLVKSTD
jgi:serine/threonine-protein kinase RsbW